MQIESIAADRLEGAAAIAEFLGVPERRARHLISGCKLPVGYEGRRLVASKRVLEAHWRRITGGSDQTAAT